ncbi:uncharacterized protein MKK02DRAFT_38536 [Dioszegia hungarica]|uniref:Uncharacterized protein n=1 Tax=Dioszegia hungarica TaxID=4972 RepID=A0AA38LSW6_9TREE|nr:uncharacterized protein MKK02DRAFT_38536 [Dioszegia hungarica]KAI9633868.1 hypothetical protein MKK02DRAFT_38536 [Dioszegia hungarica]
MSSQHQGRAYFRLNAPIDASSEPTIGIVATRLLDPIGSFGQTEDTHRKQLQSLIQNHLHTLTHNSADQDRTLVAVAKSLMRMTCAATISVPTGTCPDDTETVNWELAAIDLSVGGETYATVHRVPESPSILQTTYKPLSGDQPASALQTPSSTHTSPQPAPQTSAPINVALHIGVIKPGIIDGVVQDMYRIQSERYTVRGTEGDDESRLSVLNGSLAKSVQRANGSRTKDLTISCDAAKKMCYAAGMRALWKGYGDLTEDRNVVVQVCDTAEDWETHKQHALSVYQEAWGSAATGETPSPSNQIDEAGGGTAAAECQNDESVRTSGCSRLTKVAGIVAVTGAVASALYYSLRDTLSDE